MLKLSSSSSSKCMKAMGIWWILDQEVLISQYIFIQNIHLLWLLSRQNESLNDLNQVARKIVSFILSVPSSMSDYFISEALIILRDVVLNYIKRFVNFFNWTTRWTVRKIAWDLYFLFVSIWLIVILKPRHHVMGETERMVWTLSTKMESDSWMLKQYIMPVRQ